MSADNKEEQSAPEVELDIVAMPTEEANPIKRPFEQTVKIEWTPSELIGELTKRTLEIEKYAKEIEGIRSLMSVHLRHIEHLKRVLDLPEVKVLVDAEAEYLKSTTKKDAVDESMETPKVEEEPKK